MTYKHVGDVGRFKFIIFYKISHALQLVLHFACVWEP